jgi:tagatose 1,6-diphosphate aldolase GatY/KbaY
LFVQQRALKRALKRAIKEVLPMPLETSGEMLILAQAGGYAIGAFNIENMEMAQAVVEAAEELKAPVILQTTPSTLRYARCEVYYGIVNALAEKSSVPVALHLDHGDSLDLCAKALQAGYTSVMIDGSKLPLEENIALTKQVADMCRTFGVQTEGELGQVGGKEDDTENENAGYTVPSQAVRFERETGLFSMAVGVGTAHGFYSAPPVLNLELISELKRNISVPMVLHGASGLSDETVRECIRRGICKVNFATELRAAYTGGVRDVLREKPDTYDPKAFGKAGRERVKAFVKERILVCGCAGKV